MGVLGVLNTILKYSIAFLTNSFIPFLFGDYFRSISYFRKSSENHNKGYFRKNVVLPESFDSVETKMNKKLEKIEAKRKNKPGGSCVIPNPSVSCNWFAFVKKDRKMLKNKKGTHDKHRLNINDFVKSSSHNRTMVTKVLALDCEMVSDMEDKNMLGRVSIVNYKLQCVYDKYVKPSAPVGDYRTRFSGLREGDLEKGVEFGIVQREVKDLLKNKILVGHAIHHDLRVLKLGHPRKLIRDTSKYEIFRLMSDGKSPSLKKLANLVLGENIQEGEHDSIEDAKTAMKLYIKFRHEWEMSALNADEENYMQSSKMKLYNYN